MPTIEFSTATDAPVTAELSLTSRTPAPVCTSTDSTLSKNREQAASRSSTTSKSYVVTYVGPEVESHEGRAQVAAILFRLAAAKVPS